MNCVLSKIVTKARGLESGASRGRIYIWAIPLLFGTFCGGMSWNGPKFWYVVVLEKLSLCINFQTRGCIPSPRANIYNYIYHSYIYIYTSGLRPLLAPLANPRAFVTILDNTRFVLKILNKSGGGCLRLLRDMLLYNIRSNLGQKTKSFIEPFFLNLDYSFSDFSLLPGYADVY